MTQQLSTSHTRDLFKAMQHPTLFINDLETGNECAWQRYPSKAGRCAVGSKGTEQRRLAANSDSFFCAPVILQSPSFQDPNPEEYDPNCHPSF